MHFLFSKAIYLALSVLTIVSALIVTHAPATQEGPFKIENCGPGTEAIKILLRLLPDTLQPAIEDASRFVASEAYITFFKNIVYASHVRDVLYNVSIGAPVPVNTAGESPWIFCITGLGQVTWGTKENPGGDLYSGYLSHNSPATAHISPDAPFIFIFPGFWDHPSVPSTSPSTCLTVAPHFNKYKQNGEDYISYQLWILLHELIHQYAYDFKPEAPREFFFVNDCLRLPASKAILNPQNYIFYVANIHSGCTTFPTPSRPGRQIELLEVNQSSIAFNDSRYGLPQMGHRY